MFELAIGILLGVASFLLLRYVFKGNFPDDLDYFDYENTHKVRGGLGNTTKNSAS